MVGNYLKLTLALSLWLFPGVSASHSRFALQAATNEQLKPSPSNIGNLYSNLGRRGRGGSNGRNGRDGRNGTNKTISVDGSAVDLDLSGTDGEDGGNGRYGSDAVCYRINKKYREDIRLPDGGRGGNGGKGGNGGDGGSLTIYYDRLEDLKRVSVVSSGGYGGRGGEEGVGGRGCLCPFRTFQSSLHYPGYPNYYNKNHDKHQHHQEKRYYCYDGRDGRWGRVGRDGIDGKLGKLYLIEGGQKLLPENLKESISFSEIDRGKTLKLVNNIWQSREGAIALLQPNSIIADTYEEYIKRLTRNISIVWQEARPTDDFADEFIEFELTEKNKLAIAYPEKVWLDATIKTDREITVLTIDRAIAEEETTRLARGLISGNRSNLVFSAIDLAQKSEIINTQFKIKYRTGGSSFSSRRDSLSYKTRYEGIVPAAAVTRNNQRFALNLGSLPIDNKYLSPGTAIEIELTVIRSLGDNSAEQKIYWQGEID